MKIVCAVFDSAVQSFGQPFFVPAVGSAVRSFSDEVNRDDAQNQLNRHSDDFVLWQLAEFDEDNGIFIQNADVKRVLARAKDLKNGGQS